MKTFRDALSDLINSCSMENDPNTPDFILASYLESCLKAFDTAVIDRELHYGRSIEENKT